MTNKFYEMVEKVVTPINEDKGIYKVKKRWLAELLLHMARMDGKNKFSFQSGYFYEWKDRRCFILTDLMGKPLGFCGWTLWRTKKKYATMEMIWLVECIRGRGMGYDLGSISKDEIEKEGFKAMWGDIETEEGRKLIKTIFEKEIKELQKKEKNI